MSPHHSGYIAAICTILTCSLFSFSLLCKISMVVLGVGWRACSWVIWHLVFFLSGWFSLRFIDAPGIYVLVFVLSVASLWGTHDSDTTAVPPPLSTKYKDAVHESKKETAHRGSKVPG